MENNNADWMAVQTQVGDQASFADIYNLGVDPSSVTLDTRDTYKNKAKIKSNPAFITNGKFDDKKFDSFYDASVKTLNAYKTGDYSIGSGNVPQMNLWEDTDLAKSLKQKTYKDPISIKTNKDPELNLRLAQKSRLGFIDINQWSNPEKSIAEVAQGQKVLDGATGKELNYTVEDTSFSNAFGFFKEPLVLSAYDADIKDEVGNTIHKKGETKFDAKGMPRYETLAGRNASGKQILSRFDTLTKEDSYLNKFDFMDSDDLDKSLGGSIVKTAVSLLPLALGGPVATAAKAFYIADGLVQAGTEISKALMGIAGGKDADKSEFYKALNNVQAYTKQWKSGTSENAKQNFFAAENVLNLAADSVYQLMGQQGLAMWPQRIRQYQMAKALNLNPNLMTSLSKEGDAVLSGVTKFENYVAKYGDDAGKAAVALSKNVKQLENMAKYSSYGATAFMAATSATGISDVADQAGLNARDKGLLYLGYTAGLAPLFRMNIGHWVEAGFEVDELAHGMNKAIKQYGSQYLSPVLGKAEKDAAAEAATQLAKESLTGLAKIKDRGLDMLIAGKKLGQRVAAKFENVSSPLVAGLAEGTEEITEEALMDAIKGIYNGLSQMGLTSTDDKKIDFDMSDAMSRYGQAFVGGAIGGMIFKFVDPEVHIHPFISEDLKEYVANGFGNDAIDRIKGMADRGELGSTQLSINKAINGDGVLQNDVWAPVNKDNPVSQNDFIADRMIQEIRANMVHMDVFGLSNPDSFTDGKNKFYDTIVDTRTDTDLRDRIRSTSDDMIALSNEIKNMDDDDINKPALKKKKEEFKELQKQFDYLTGDESVDEYFRQGLFNISTDINSKFGVKTRESFAKELVGLNADYTTLNDKDKEKVDLAYNAYRISNDDTYGIRADLRNARLQMEAFDADMKEHGGYETIENYNESLKTLKDYAVEGKGMVNGEATDQDLISLTSNFYDNMKDVKYIPDFMHDEINKRITDIKENGLNSAIDNIGVKNGIPIDTVAYRQALLDGNIDKLNPTKPMDKLFKAYLSKYNPVTVFDSPSYKVLQEQGNLVGLSSMIKSLKEVNNIKDDSPEKQLYVQRKEAIDSLTPEEARVFAIKVAEDLSYNQGVQGFFQDEYPDVVAQQLNIKPEVYTELVDMLQKANYEKILDDEPYINSGEEAVNLLNNINRQQFLSSATGENANFNLGSLTSSRGNILMDHAIDGTLNNSPMNVDVMSNIDSQVDDLAGKMENAMKEKATSPLASFLANTYNFKNGEFETIYKNGASNYLNQSEDYEATLNDHIDQTQKVEAYLRGLFTLNPVINEWRKTHPDLVPEKLRKETLTELSPLGFGTIYQNANILLNELQYLKELNDFNKNNTLAKLLKEDGKQLASSFKTLEKIALEDEVTQALPSLEKFLNDPVVKEYIEDIDLAVDLQKIKALGAAAKHETNIYNDFQNLSDVQKQRILDITFKPINSDSYEYRNPVNADSPLSDMHQTVYLAKIFGSSSLDYTRAVAGEEVDGSYVKIAASQMDPFPNQEAAIRLAYLNRFGDPIVKKSLTSAFAYRSMNEAPITFKRDDSAGINVDNTITIVGDPGVGKTKAIVAGILSFDNDINSDTVLLGSVTEHVQNLASGVTNAGFEDRINKSLSNTVSNFIKDLELVDSSNKIVNINTNTDAVLGQLADPGEYNDDYDSDQRMEQHLKSIADNIMYPIKLWEDNGTLSTTLEGKLQGVRNIIIDEFTHVNPVDLAIISHVVEAYNKNVSNDPNKKITITLAGDNNQLGFEVDGLPRTFADFVKLDTSLPLTTSLRSGWDLVNNTLIEVKNRTSQINDMSNAQLRDPLTASNLRNIAIRFNYTVADGKPIGIYRQEAEGETTSEHLKFLADHVELIKSSPNSLVYVAQDINSVPAAEALMRNMLGQDWKDFASVLTAEKTQGREFKYAIIDADPSDSKEAKLVSTYKFLNTMLSRATEATLLIDKGAYAQYATFSQAEVPKAIDQKKLTPEMITGIKENRQAVTKAKLDNSENIISEPAVEPAPVIAQDATDTQPIVTQPETVSEAIAEPDPELSDIPADNPSNVVNVMQILDDNDINALLTPELTTLIDNSDPTDDFVRTQKYMVNAYTSFTFKRDTAAVNNLMGNNLSDIQAESLLMKLKEMVTYGAGEFGPAYFNNSELVQRLRDKGYELRKTDVRLTAIKRNSDFMTVGRSKWNNNYVEKEGENLLLVEGIIPNKLNPENPFIYTIGTFNSLGNIMKYGGDVDSVRQFVDNVKSQLDSSQMWQSPQFTMTEWKNMATRREFKVDFKSDVDNAYSDLKKNYNQNMTLTDPLLIIAKPDDRTNTLTKWKDLTGQSIAFATEHAALRGKTSQELYEIYKNQILKFNTDEYRAMSYEDKETYVNSLPKIQVPGTSGIVPRPRLVSLIRLTNPKYNFMEFVTNYNGFVSNYKEAQAKGQKVDLAEEVREFEMSPYVADRLVKSMMVVHRMLTDDNTEVNRQWFESTVLPKTQGNVLNKIESYMAQTKAQAKQEGSDFSFGNLQASDFISNETDATALRSTDDLVAALDKYLYGNDNLVRGIYKTDAGALNKIKGIELNPTVDMQAILPDTLTNSKFDDFSKNGVLKVKNLSIYNGLKPSFLQMINESLIALGGIPTNDPIMGKYSLADVFKDGKIENVIVAGVGTNGRHLTNVIAPIKQTSLTSGFRTNAASVQSTSFFVDFDKMMAKIGEIGNSNMSANERSAKEDVDRVAATNLYVQTLQDMGVTSQHEGADELLTRSFATEADATKALTEPIQLKLKPDAINLTLNTKYIVDNSDQSENTFGSVVKDTINKSIKDTGSLVVVEGEYPDRVDTHLFDKNNDWNHTVTTVYKSEGVLNATDEAKKLIDSNNLTPGTLLESSKANLVHQEDYAKDITKLKGKDITLETPEGTKKYKVMSSSIGLSGELDQSYVGLLDLETGNRTNISQASLREKLPEFANLPIHPNAEIKANDFYSDPNNLDPYSEVFGLVETKHPNATTEEHSAIAEQILDQLGIKESDVEFDDPRSTFKKITNDIETNSNNLIVNPFADDQMDSQTVELVDAYNNLAKGIYADNLHTSNGFVNNFSIFADNQWENYQEVINGFVNNPNLVSDPTLSKNILKLEEQLNKLTHDC